MDTLNHQRYFSYFLFSGLFLLIAMIVILSCVPPVSRDALAHHLAVPKLYIMHGGIYEIPSITFSYYPMNLETLYLIPLYFGNDIMPKLMHFIFALLTAWLIFKYLREKIDLTYAMLGVLFFLSLPIIVKLSITAYVDLGLIFFSSASLICILKWVECNFSYKYLILSGVWCGLALGTKYNGLICLLIITLFIPFIYVRAARNEPSISYKGLWCGTIFMLTALLVFSPWMVRNYIWTHNPIYPLFNIWFNPPSETGSFGHYVSGSGALGHFVRRKVIFGEQWWEIALIPVRIFFQGMDDSPQYFDGKLNPYLFILPLFAFLDYKKNLILTREKKIMAFFIILFFSFIFFQEVMRIRWIAPIIPPLVILSIVGLYEINMRISAYGSHSSAAAYRAVVVIAIAYMFLININYIVEQFKIVTPFNYIIGRISRDAYIENFRPAYAAMQFANQSLSKDAKILCLYIGNRIYYSDREMVCQDNMLKSLIKTSESPDMVVQELVRQKITHILIRADLFKTSLRNNFNSKELQLLDNFFKEYLTPVFSKGGYWLLALKV